MKGDFNKAKEISPKTKAIVLDRQYNKSISGVNLYNKEVEFHHVIPRSSSGVGYEWNVVALTSEEHRDYTDHRPIKVNGREYYTWEEFDTLIKNHLKLRYSGWSEKLCKYHKGWEKEDYKVIRFDVKF